MTLKPGDHVIVNDLAKDTIKSPWVGHTGVVDKVLLGGRSISIKWDNPKSVLHGEFGGIVIAPQYLDVVEDDAADSTS